MAISSMKGAVSERPRILSRRERSSVGQSESTMESLNQLSLFPFRMVRLAFPASSLVVGIDRLSRELSERVGDPGAANDQTRERMHRLVVEGAGTVALLLQSEAGDSAAGKMTIPARLVEEVVSLAKELADETKDGKLAAQVALIVGLANGLAGYPISKLATMLRADSAGAA
ncbi:hypothetical protein [Mesorhizobium sp. M0500]|uniref:hypothetical protein n=1 Tax=Mesorhizobium sp. M0500 TaxID=2956953 RepID=UPI0033351300